MWTRSLGSDVDPSPEPMWTRDWKALHAGGNFEEGEIAKDVYATAYLLAKNAGAM